MTWYTIAGNSLTVLGGLIFLAAGIGLLRLRDPYTRTSAVATAAGLGIAFVVGGTALTDPGLAHGVKVAIAIVLQLITSAVGGMTIARAAVLSGHDFVETDTTDLDDPQP